MATDGDPEKATSAMMHNGDVLLGDRNRLIRWQTWWDESTRASANKDMMRNK